MNLRYNVQYIDPEAGGEEEPHNYIHYADLIALIGRMKDGHELVVQAVEDKGGI